MGNTLPKLHQVIGIAYNNDLNNIHGRTITSFDVYHKVIKWALHHMNILVLFRRYIRSLDILELNVLIVFLFFITIGKVCMLKFEMSLLVVNKVNNENFFFLLTTHDFSTPYSGHVLLMLI
jgi:hypothetical protein